MHTGGRRAQSARRAPVKDYNSGKKLTQLQVNIEPYPTSRPVMEDQNKIGQRQKQ
jgi:hypothetical protein